MTADTARTAKRTPGPTPGEWKWYWQQEDGEANCGVFAEPRKGHAYAIARCPRYQKREQWAADARLIAAAPDLLAALEALTDWGRDHTSPLDVNSPHQLLVDARAAIAKARGE